MEKMKMKLTKIKLINWHLFTNHEIDVKGNLLITGNNGNGKSTLIDAIFYVLSGGNERNFNVASNVAGDYGRSRTSQRTLSTYMRCKLGNEGKEFIRNEANIITHIALEFYDPIEQEYNVLGCVLSIENSSKPKEKFYIIRKNAVKDLIYIENDVNILDYYGFKSANSTVDFSPLPDSKTDRRKQIVQFMKISNAAKYFDLLQASVAFKPINSNVSDFVFHFLLKEDDVKIDALATELAQYQQLHAITVKERQKLELLETFIEKAEKYEKYRKEIEYLEVLDREHKIESEKEEIKKIDFRSSKTEQEKQNLEKMRSDAEDLVRSLDSEIATVEQKDELKRLREKEIQEKELADKITSIDDKIEEIQSLLQFEQEIGKELGLEYDFFKHINSGNIVMLNKYVAEYCDRVREKKQKLAKDDSKKEDEIKECEARIYNIEKDLYTINNGKNNYEDYVLRLIKLIKNELKAKYNRDISVTPLCECIDIIDKEWTDAIEGYLGGHRFDLIISPEYFYDAAEIYEKNAKAMGIYGISVINTGAPAINYDANSLYNKIKILNPYAKAICTKLLGRAICAESVRDFKPGKPYVTKSCMVYSNDSVSAINPKNYRVPFIGEDSVLKRKELLTQELGTANNTLRNLKIENREIKRLKNVIYRSELKANEIPNYWLDRKRLQVQIDELKADIEVIKQSKDILSIAKQLDALKVRRDEKYNLAEKYRENIKSLQVELNKCGENLVRHKVQLEGLEQEYGLMIESLQNPKEYELFRDDFSKSNGDPANEIARRNRSNANNVDSIKSGMREYVQEFNRNLSADMENLSDFIAEYNQIKDQSLVNSEAQAKQAFITAQTSFNANFISNLRSRIEHAKDTLDGLNYTLKHHPFGGDGEYYQFRMQDSGDREMKEYADIIMSGKEMGQKDLFTETLDTHERDIMQSLFDKVATINDSTLAAKDLNKYLDYRQYKSYDIEVINKNGEKYFFSKNNDGKSGGEKQTPFYVIIGSCYNELIKKDETESGACIAIFDEAFNNMDEPRIMTLMEYYRKLNIQLIIVVPTNHSSNIIPYVNNVVEIIKRDNVINLAYLYNE